MRIGRVIAVAAVALGAAAPAAAQDWWPVPNLGSDTALADAAAAGGLRREVSGIAARQLAPPVLEGG
jgi:hypothetical protein